MIAGLIDAEPERYAIGWFDLDDGIDELGYSWDDRGGPHSDARVQALSSARLIAEEGRVLADRGAGGASTRDVAEDRRATASTASESPTALSSRWVSFVTTPRQRRSSPARTDALHILAGPSGVPGVVPGVTRF